MMRRIVVVVVVVHLRVCTPRTDQLSAHNIL